MRLLADLRYGVRMLLGHPGLTSAAVLSLALGIGANTAIYSWVKAILLRPVPGAVRQQDIVEVLTRTRAGTPNSVSYPDYVDIRDDDLFAGVFAQGTASLNLTTDDTRVDARRLWGSLVSANYFDVLGVRAVVGRTFLPEEDRTPGGHPVVVLNYRTWQRYFKGDPGVVGSTVMLNGHPFTVVGVTPEAFQGTFVMLDTAAWAPMMMQEQLLPGGSRLDERGSRWVQVMARLRPDVPLSQANAGLGALAAQLAREYPESAADRTFDAVPLHASPFGPQPILRPVFLVLSGVVGVVLLIACANVANLLLARAVGRRREIAIRLAMGASRARLVRQLLTESVLLAACGGVLGLLVALWGRGLLMDFAPPTDFPVRVAVSVDVNLLAFAAAVSVATGLLFGLAPALQASSPALVNVLREESSAAGGGRTRARLRGLLVAGQVALSLLLLAGAALFVQALERAQVVDPGFDPSHAIRASFDLFPNGYTTEEGLAFQRRLVERLEATPDVESAAVARRVPLDIGGFSSTTVRIDGYEPAPNEEMQVTFNAVGPGYFRTMRVPIVTGRPIDETDRLDTTPVVVINETMAARYWRGRDPVGALVRIGDTARRVVGIAANGKYATLGERPTPYMYFPLAQAYRSDTVVQVRTAGDPASFVPTLREVVKSLDPNLPLHDVMTMEAHMGFATIGSRMAASLLGLFGALALGLATVGLYGVVAFAVGQRTREVGIRMALGAQPRAIRADILRQGLGLTLAGIAIGLLVTAAVMPLAASQLYDVNPRDPATLGGVALVLTAVALVATYLPARRASRIDPVEALRHE